MKTLMSKSLIHPTWYLEAKVYCDGHLIFKIGATQSKLEIDVWSGVHPVYTGSDTILDMGGKIKDFINKYGWSD